VVIKVVIKVATLVVRPVILLNPPSALALLVTLSKEVGSDFVVPDDRALNKRYRLPARRLPARWLPARRGLPAAARLPTRQLWWRLLMRSPLQS